MWKYILILVLFFNINIIAQEVDSNRMYFPYADGNMWEYFYEHGPLYRDTIQVFNTLDSTDAVGNVYVTQRSRYINPIQIPGVPFSDLSRYMIDTNNQVWDLSNNFLWLKLNAKQGEQWVVQRHGDSVGGFIGRVK